MPPEATAERGMQVLELKLSILMSGPGQRRNPALDVLTGRVPDERLVTLQAGLTVSHASQEPWEATLVPFGAGTGSAEDGAPQANRAETLAGSTPETQGASLTETPAAGPSETPAASRQSATQNPKTPTAVVLPVAAIRMAAVARSRDTAQHGDTRQSLSPWLQSAAQRQRVQLVAPPPSRWDKIPLVRNLVAWVRAEFRPYTWRARSPRAHPAS